MKKLLTLLACALLAGCDYTVPLTTAPAMELDKSLLGLWENSTEDNKIDQLLVLPLDAKEYLVSFPSGDKDGMFARACLCRAGDKTLVQLKWFGTADGKLPEDNRVYQYASYAVEGGKLTVRFLNTEVVSKNAASTEELAGFIAANGDKTNLFKAGTIFTKVNK
jgi:hypothetical protein